MAAEQQRAASERGRLLVQIRSLEAGLGHLAAQIAIQQDRVGLVKAGQSVRLLYDASPYQHYGTYRGRIVRVSQSIVAAAEVSTPVTLEGPAYRAIVAPERPDIDAYGKRVPLQPDMPLPE